MNVSSEHAEKTISVSEKVLDKFTEILGEYRVTLEAIKDVLEEERRFENEVDELRECLDSCKQKFDTLKFQTGYEPRNNQEVL